MIDALNNWLLPFGLSNDGAAYIRLGAFLALLCIVVITIDRAAKWVLVRWISFFIKKDRHTLGAALLEKQVFRAIANLVHILMIQMAIPLVFIDFPGLVPVALKANEIYILIGILFVITAFFKAVGHYVKQMPSLKDKPIDSYVQLAQIIIVCIGVLFSLSILLGKSLPYLFGTLGATSAILLLIFKDSLLGFVASIQLSVNDMVRIGDWIENPKYGADGDVIQITLTTVKVQNWDKTITTMPTYALVSDSFRNWRGMRESGGRRIKRPIYFNIASFRFCDDDLLERLRRFPLLADYLNDRTAHISSGTHADAGQRTNIGLFRHYAAEYLRTHSRINHDLLFMVRQLEPQEFGLPMEIYAFTNTVVWTEYEAIQADIFDHLLTIAPVFDLEVFQKPSGKDVEKLRS